MTKEHIYSIARTLAEAQENASINDALVLQNATENDTNLTFDQEWYDRLPQDSKDELHKIAQMADQIGRVRRSSPSYQDIDLIYQIMAVKMGRQFASRNLNQENPGASFGGSSGFSNNEIKIDDGLSLDVGMGAYIDDNMKWISTGEFNGKPTPEEYAKFSAEQKEKIHHLATSDTVVFSGMLGNVKGGNDVYNPTGDQSVAQQSKDMNDKLAAGRALASRQGPSYSDIVTLAKIAWNNANELNRAYDVTKNMTQPEYDELSPEEKQDIHTLAVYQMTLAAIDPKLTRDLTPGELAEVEKQKKARELEVSLDNYKTERQKTNITNVGKLLNSVIKCGVVLGENIEINEDPGHQEKSKWVHYQNTRLIFDSVEQAETWLHERWDKIQSKYGNLGLDLSTQMKKITKDQMSGTILKLYLKTPEPYGYYAFASNGTNKHYETRGGIKSNNPDIIYDKYTLYASLHYEVGMFPVMYRDSDPDKQKKIEQNKAWVSDSGYRIGVVDSSSMKFSGFDDHSGRTMAKAR